MQKFTLLLIVLLGILLGIALVGCGTKGPLYIPEKQYPQTPAP